MESLLLGSAQLLADRLADIGRLARDLALDVVETPDTLQGLVCDFGFSRRPDIIEIGVRSVSQPQRELVLQPAKHLQRLLL